MERPKGISMKVPNCFAAPNPYCCPNATAPFPGAQGSAGPHVSGFVVPPSEQFQGGGFGSVPSAAPTFPSAATIQPPVVVAQGNGGRYVTGFAVPQSQQYQGVRINNKAATGPFGPEPGFQPQLTNQGGAVLTQPVISNIYVGSYWNTAAGQKDVQQNNAMATDFGKSQLMDVAGQYGAGKASFAGSTVQSSSLKTLTESDIQSVVQQAIASGSVQKNAQGIYTVILPPGVVLDAGGGVTSKQGLGGFHGSYDDGSGHPVYYAAIAYSDTKGNGINFDGNSEDAVNITESHEWMEAMTDPDVNSTISGLGTAWYDTTNNAEIGDEMMPLELNAGLNIDQSFEKDAGGFAQQMEWSNQDNLFEINSASDRGS